MIRRYCRIYLLFLRTCLVRELQFRVNFAMQVAVALMWVSYYVLTIKVIYHNTASVAGWREGDMMVLTGSYILVRGVLCTVFWDNWHEFPQQVATGKFDIALTKPVDTQFMAYCRYINWSEMSRIFGSLALLVYGFRQTGAALTPARVGMYLVALACSFGIMLAMYSLVVTSAFWLIRVQHLTVAVDNTMTFAKYPDGIYQGGLRVLVTVILPFAFLAAVPARALTGRLAWEQLALGLLLAAVLLTLSRLYWQRAVANYSSAGG